MVTEIVNYLNTKPESSHVASHGRTFTSPSCSQAFLFGGDVMRGKLNDLTGQRFEKWLVINRSIPNGKDGDALWNCQCDCGTVRPVNGNSLKRGETKSCGCIIGHGDSLPKNTSRAYLAWGNMKSRCLNSNGQHYSRYGARGITICNRWKNSYKNFRKDMGQCPEGLTLERINNNHGYSPDNCKWATRKEQSKNRYNNVWIEQGGKKMVQKDWCRELNVNSGSWQYHKSKGMSDEDVLNYYIHKKEE